MLSIQQKIISLLVIGRKYRHLFLFFTVYDKNSWCYMQRKSKKTKKGREKGVEYLKVLVNNEDNK